MATDVAAWKVAAPTAQPQRLPTSALQLEIHLEEWIASDPALVEDGLAVVHRQLRLEGGPLDLLCLDAQGGLHVVELKRGGLHRDTLAQAIDYAASISLMPAADLLSRLRAYLAKHPNEAARERLEEQARLDLGDTGRREVGLILVGTGRDAGLDRVTDFLADGYGLPIRVVTFQVLDLGDGDQILVREASEGTAPEPPRGAAAYTWEGVLANASAMGLGEAITAVRHTALRLGLYPRPWKVSLMLTPPDDKRRFLLTFWPKESRPGELGLAFSKAALMEFFQLSEGEIDRALGSEERTSLTPSEVDGVLDKLDLLLTPSDGTNEGSAVLPP